MELFGPWLSKASAVMLLAACRQGTGAADLEQRYQWGEPCSEKLAVGLAVSSSSVSGQSPLRWRVAIKNLAGNRRELVISNDVDLKPRYRVHAVPADGGPAAELLPTAYETITTGNIRHTIDVAAGGIRELAEETFVPGSRLAPGKYRLTAIFGGEGFDFRCESGQVEVTVE